MNYKIKTKGEIKEIAEKLKTEGKNIVTTNGVFDLLHVGHIDSFISAKQFGDVLVVGVNSDQSVKSCVSHEGVGKNKIVPRPIVNEKERAQMLAALQVIDYVVVFDEPNPNNFLEHVRPHFHVKGRDWEGKRIPEMDILESYGGEMRYIDLLEGYSTTEIIKRIADKL